MYTLKGIFPEPKKDQKRNFIKENMKQLKQMQGKSMDTGVPAKGAHPSGRVSGKAADVRIKKGDMSEFVKNKELRRTRPPPAALAALADDASDTSTVSARSVACQTNDHKVTTLYKKDPAREAEGDHALLRSDTRSRIDTILERKDKNKDPYLPQGYQKGVVPKYLRERMAGESSESAGEEVPAGHVLLPDTERKETLRMLRHSFGELVCELNKLPVRTDTLRARARKAELEARLAKLEDGIRVFSRATVYVKVND